MKRVGIVGMGNIGKRHLQSIATIKDIDEFFCYDISQESLIALDNFLLQNKITFKKFTKYHDFQEFIKEIDSSTIIIVATTANNRVSLIESIYSQTPKAIILEKPVCQTIEEYESILKKDTSSTQIYVNFPRHMYPHCQKIKEIVDIEGGIRMDARERKTGIACTGIHLIEFAWWLFKGQEYEIISSKISEPFETKRKDFFDVTGQVTFLLNKKIEINIDDDCEISDFHIYTPKQVIRVIEEEGKMISIINDSKEEQDIRAPYQSELTAKIVNEIYEKKETNQIPTLKESFAPHQILFSLFKQHGLKINFT